jgi:hypothetical protein
MRTIRISVGAAPNGNSEKTFLILLNIILELNSFLEKSFRKIISKICIFYKRRILFDFSLNL